MAPHLTVQVQGLPHKWQGDEFLGALAPGPQEVVGQDAMSLGSVGPRQVALLDHLGQLSAERGHVLMGPGGPGKSGGGHWPPRTQFQMQLHPNPFSGCSLGWWATCFVT